MESSISKVVDVKIISKEAMKPSTPTPYHCRNFALSYVDQILPVIPPFPTSVLLFYTAPPQTHPFDLNQLKNSLSQTLTKFYPLAGRIDQSIITCDDEGIPLIVANVDCTLSIVLNSEIKLDLVTKLLPPRESLGISSRGLGLNLDDLGPCDRIVHLAIQISTFTCGGVAIGWYDLHKIMDGTSSTTFFKHWAALSSKQFDLIVGPDFDASVSLFPPSQKPNILDFKSGHKNNNAAFLKVKSFIFKDKAINELKSRSASKLVPNPTRVQALSGFIWEQLLVVSEVCNQNPKPSDSILQVTIDMRPFTNPQLPKGSIGNLVDTAVARASRLGAKLPALVAEIHAAVSTTKKAIRRYDGAAGIRASWDKVIKAATVYKENAYKIVSWCNLGFTDLDFGFGKPIWMVPTDGIMSPFHRNLIILTDFVESSEKQGIEAWLFLEDKELKALESNPSFLAYASPA